MHLAVPEFLYKTSATSITSREETAQRSEHSYFALQDRILKTGTESAEMPCFKDNSVLIRSCNARSDFNNKSACFSGKGAVSKKGGFGECTLVLVVGTAGTSECTLILFLGTGEHPPKPLFCKRPKLVIFANSGCCCRRVKEQKPPKRELGKAFRSRGAAFNSLFCFFVWAGRLLSASNIQS